MLLFSVARRAVLFLPVALNDAPLDAETFLTDVPVLEQPEAELPVLERARRRTPSKDDARPTERLRISVRVARPDGTFEVRDGDEPLKGDLDVSLYGRAAPANVALFLELALGEEGLSYKRSNFDEIRDGLLIGGRVAGLDQKLDLGRPVLVYGDREVFASREDRRLLEEAKVEPSRPIDRKGLVVRPRTGDIDYGITLAPVATDDWVVLGEVVRDDAGLLDVIAGLPTYAAEPVGDFAATTPFATDVFNAQRALFRTAASRLKDTRLNSVFPGKILRRVEVTDITLLS